MFCRSLLQKLLFSLVRQINQITAIKGPAGILFKASSGEPVKEAAEKLAPRLIRPSLSRQSGKLFVGAIQPNGTGDEQSIKSKIVFRKRKRSDQTIDDIEAVTMMPDIMRGPVRKPNL